MISIKVKFLLISLKAAIMFVAIWGTQSKADFFLVPKEENDKAMQLCADEISEQNFINDLRNYSPIEQIRKKIGSTDLGVACFKNKSFDFGNIDDTIIVVYHNSSGTIKDDNDLLSQVNEQINYRINLQSTGSDFKKAQVQVEVIGDIFNEWSGATRMTIEQFIETINQENNSFLKLIQFNLNVPYSRDEFDKIECNGVTEGKGFYEGEIDGLWGNNTKHAITEAVQKCGDSDQDLLVGANLVTELFLPQIFAISKSGTETNTKTNGRSDETTISDMKREHNELVSELVSEIISLQKIKNQSDHRYSEIVRERDEAVAERDRAKQRFDKQSSRTIVEIWDGFPIDVWGELPENSGRQLADKNALTTSCRISPDKTLLATALDAYMSEDCFEYNFTIGEIDTKKKYTLRELSNGQHEIIVPLLPERIKTIVSVRTMELNDLSPQSIPNCGLKMTFLRDGQTVISLDPTRDNSGLYPNVSKDSQSVWLSDQNTIKTQAIKYAGLNVRLETTDSENQKCALEEPVEISIIEDKYADNGKPQAVIDRAGNLKLYDLPLTLVKGTTLVVFFDANVGHKEQDWYAFNRSLNDKEIQKRQKVYFSGFLEGLQEYLENQTNIENIIVYKSIGYNDNPQTVKEFEVIFKERNIQDPKARDLAIEALNKSKNDLVSGQQGSFSNKLKMIKNLQTKNKPVKFVSFGPSGYIEDQACNTNRIMFDSEFLILDIWPTIILDRLNDKGAISAKPGALAYECKSSQNILGFRISSTTSNSKEISPSVAKYLETFLGE